jgi:hypothetical protein
LVKYQQVHDEPLSKDQAKAALNSSLEDGTVIYTRHFRDELARDDLTMEDVLTACRSGGIVMAPEKDIRTGDWKYRIEGFTAERRRIAVVFRLRLADEAVLITVFERTA